MTLIRMKGRFFCCGGWVKQNAYCPTCGLGSAEKYPTTESDRERSESCERDSKTGPGERVGSSEPSRLARSANRGSPIVSDITPREPLLQRRRHPSRSSSCPDPRVPVRRVSLLDRVYRRVDRYFGRPRFDRPRLPPREPDSDLGDLDEPVSRRDQLGAADNIRHRSRDRSARRTRSRYSEAFGGMVSVTVIGSA